MYKIAGFIVVCMCLYLIIYYIINKIRKSPTFSKDKYTTDYLPKQEVNITAIKENPSCLEYVKNPLNSNVGNCLEAIRNDKSDYAIRYVKNFPDYYPSDIMEDIIKIIKKHKGE